MGARGAPLARERGPPATRESARGKCGAPSTPSHSRAPGSAAHGPSPPARRATQSRARARARSRARYFPPACAAKRPRTPRAVGAGGARGGMRSRRRRRGGGRRGSSSCCRCRGRPRRARRGERAACERCAQHRAGRPGRVRAAHAQWRARAKARAERDMQSDVEFFDFPFSSSTQPRICRRGTMERRSNTFKKKKKKPRRGGRSEGDGRSLSQGTDYSGEIKSQRRRARSSLKGVSS